MSRFNPWRDPRPALPARRPKRPGRSARYYTVLSPEPTALTQDAARIYLAELLYLLRASLTALAERGIYGAWTRHERANLTRLVKRWEARAAGRDTRWLRVGARAGGYQGTGLTKDDAATLTPRRPDPAWTDD
jgi:hypothetical protein